VKTVSAGRWRRFLALFLLIAGAALLIVGLSQLVGNDGTSFLGLLSTRTPTPTATEPILPPPPTATTTDEPTSTGPAPAGKTPSPGSALTTATAPDSSEPTQPSAPSPASTVAARTEIPSSPAPTVAASAVATQEQASTATATATAMSVPTPAVDGLYSSHERLGVGGGMGDRGYGLARLLGFGWYVDWTVRADAFQAPGVEYVPMVRLRNGGFTPDRETLRRAAAALPGALWLIGNEPDVKWQDNIGPEAYAQVYHELYVFLKEIDPNCQIAIGGVSQPTPLRLRYLDRILQAYQERYGQSMPVDVWNVHNFILREEQDSWGVDIPPGMPDASGRLYEIADHDNLEIFRQQIVAFRQWMKERGQQDKPLIVTEYGILMPGEYGFPPNEVERFMLGTFEFFRTASDSSLGYPRDGYRLVQRWCWFSLADPRYPTGNLLVSREGGLTPLGEAFAAYASSLP